jgi:hypothetical protein
LLVESDQLSAAGEAGRSTASFRVGDDGREIETNSNVQALQQIEAYIDSIKNAIIASLS